jgi:hypothetical protein
MGTIAPSVIKGHESALGTQAYHATALALAASLTMNGGTAVSGCFWTDNYGLDVA